MQNYETFNTFKLFQRENLFKKSRRRDSELYWRISADYNCAKKLLNKNKHFMGRIRASNLIQPLWIGVKRADMALKLSKTQKKFKRVSLTIT